MVDSLLDGKKGKTGATRNAARLRRTILLGTVVVALAIYWLADSYGVDRAELLGYLRTSGLFIALFALIGMLTGGLLWATRWLTRRLRRK
jgi:hypothetical protein